MKSRRSVRIVLTILLLFMSAGRAQAESEREPNSRIERWREASPAERRAIRAEVRERLEDATPGERRRLRRRLRRLERALPDLSSIERVVLLRAAARLPKDERRRLRKRIASVDELNPFERAELMQELQVMIENFEGGDVRRLERNRDRWESLSPQERKEMRAQMRRLRAMSVDEREALLKEMNRKND